MRLQIAVTVGQGCREVERGVLEGWLNLEGEKFEKFVVEICGWGLGDLGDGGEGGSSLVRVPVNKENEAKGTVVREEVRFDREFYCPFFFVLFSFPLRLFMSMKLCCGMPELWFGYLLKIH